MDLRTVGVSRTSILSFSHKQIRNIPIVRLHGVWEIAAIVMRWPAGGAPRTGDEAGIFNDRG
jgi:hypothetical protein